jgi:putative hydroxymethylpyrimidine transport system substrate-binding protein
MLKKISILLLVLNCISLSFALTPQKLRIILDQTPNPAHAPLIIAEQEGFFKEQGLDVELISADHNDPGKWIATGKADIGVTYEPRFMQQVDQGLPLVRIGTLIDKPLNCLVALKGSGIQTIADLKNKRIGSSKGSGLSHMMLETMLAEKDMSVKDVELVTVGHHLTQALLTGKVDAITGMKRNLDVPQLESMGHQVVTLFPEELGIPNYDQLILVINKTKTQDTRFPRFLAALEKSVAFLDAHPKESWDKFAKRYPQANNKANYETWFATIPYFAEDPASFHRKEWEKFAQFMFKNDLIKNVQPISHYAVTLPRANLFTPAA